MKPFFKKTKQMLANLIPKRKKNTIRTKIEQNKNKYGLSYELMKEIDLLVETFQASEALEVFNKKVNSVENVEVDFQNNRSISVFKKLLLKEYMTQIDLALQYAEERLERVYAEVYVHQLETVAGEVNQKK
jgi:hypothetical protein